MNKERRKQKKAAISSLNKLLEESATLETDYNENTVANFKDKLESIKDDVEMIGDEESFAFDNMPESLQGSDRGMTMEENIGYFENAISNLQESIDCFDEENFDLRNVIENIQSAIDELNNID